MRRKQVLAFLMAGALTVSMVPVSVTAAGEEALSIEQETALSEEGEEGFGDDIPAIEETPEDVPEETPAETPTETPEEPTEAPEEPSLELPEETPTEAPEQEVTIDIPAAEAPEETPTPTPEEKKNVIAIGSNSYTTLAEAFKAAAEATEEVQIKISGEFEVSETLSVPAGKTVTLAAAGETVIKRAADFTGNVFETAGNFQLTTAEVEDGEPAEGEEEKKSSLTVDGMGDSASLIEGSLVEVKESGAFFLNDGVTLKGNHTSGNGGAIRNASETGNVVLMGGSMTDNEAAQGGAVYSNGPLTVKGSISVSGNIQTAGLEANDVALDGSAIIAVAGALTGDKLNVSVVNPTEGRAVVALGEGVTDVTLADALPLFAYTGDPAFAMDETGALKTVAETPTPTPTPEVTPLKLKPVSVSWTGYDSVKVVCNSNKDGKYYVKWVKKGNKAPTFDTTQPGSEVVADYDFTAYISELPNEEVDIYVCVLDNDKQHKAVKLEPNYQKRPAAPVTPTPDHVPVIPDVKDSVVKGLENALEFYPNKFYEFRVIGAGTDNQNPGQGDVKWIPLYWSTKPNPSTNPDDHEIHEEWKIGAKGNGIAQAATYNLYIFFRKAVYDGEKWQMTDTIESATYQFKSKQIVIATPTPTATPGANGGGGGNSGYYDADGDGYDDETGDPIDYSDDADGGAKTAVATGDETPVGNMLMLAFASMFAGGYVLVRRRKKENE